MVEVQPQSLWLLELVEGVQQVLYEEEEEEARR